MGIVYDWHATFYIYIYIYIHASVSAHMKDPEHK
jgi:hypothetical protein